MMSSFFEEYHSALAKACKKNSLCSWILLASTVIFNKQWAKLYSQYSCAFLVQVIHETNDKTVTQTEVKKKLLAKTLDMGQEHTTMALHFRIKLKKGCTKNVCVHVCSNAELTKPVSKMALWYPKITVMWQVQVKSFTHYFDSF